MPLSPDQFLHDRYRVVRIIKSGGMGSVYEAIDTKLADSPCAIKEVLEEARTGQDSEYVQARLFEEMKALSRLDHPAIPRVRDFLTLDSQVYIVMDLIQGRSLLEEVMESQIPLDPELVAHDMIALLEALAYLHGQDPPIIHRDVKPANILRDRRSGSIKLVDFGLARTVQGPKTQTMVGTIGYAAPEQMMGKAEPRSDLYSVGVTLEHLLTGKIPEPDLLAGHRPQLPDSGPRSAEAPAMSGLLDIIEKATQPRLDERYSSASEMAKALKHWLNPSAPATAPLAPAPRKTGKSPLIPVLIVFLILGAVGIKKRRQAVLQPTPQPIETVALQDPPVATSPTPTPSTMPSPTPATVETPQTAETPMPVEELSPTPQAPQPELTLTPTPLPEETVPLGQPTPTATPAEAEAVRAYIEQLRSELQTLQALGEEAREPLNGIVSGLRARPDLREFLSEAEGKLSNLRDRTMETKARIEQFQPPQPAEKLHNQVLLACDQWSQTLDQAHNLCREMLDHQPTGRLRSLPPGLRLQLSQLTVSAQAAREASQRVGEEMQRLSP